MATQTHSAALDRLLERHRREAEQLRAERGDPETWVGEVIRDIFEPGDLEAAFQELTRPGSLFDHDERDER